MNKILRVMAALSLAAMSSTVQSQGVFDLSEISSKLGMGSAAAPASVAAPSAPSAAAKAPAISPEVLTYKRSPQLSAENLKKFVGGLKQFNPEFGAEFEKGVANVDLFGMMDQALGKYGVRTDNLGDVMAIYYLSSWMAVNAREEEPTPAQVDGTRKMVHATMGRVPEFAKMSDADKQGAAEGLLLQLFLNEAMVDAVKTQPDAAMKIRGEIKNAAKTNAGFEVDKFDLGAAGLVRKK